MSLFSRLFGGKTPNADPETEPETHAGCLIYPEPARDGSKWRVAARIEKQIDGEIKTHQLIRADTLDSEEAAAETAVFKARQVIDEQGDRLFD
jgi:hypothetical protein